MILCETPVINPLIAKKNTFPISHEWLQKFDFQYKKAYKTNKETVTFTGHLKSIFYLVL